MSVANHIKKGEEMLKAVKVRLYPNEEQQQIISSQIGGAKEYVYKRTLALQKYAYQKFGIKVGGLYLSSISQN
jgi:hypothetical protein